MFIQIQNSPTTACRSRAAHLGMAVALAAFIAGSVGAQHSTENDAPIFARSNSPGSKAPGVPILGDSIYFHDNGFIDDSLGLVDGGEMVWIHRYERDQFQPLLNGFHVTFGDPADPGVGGVTPDQPVRLFVWTDDENDGDPTTGTTLIYETQALVDLLSIDSNLMQVIKIPPLDIPTPYFYVGASVIHEAGFFPAPMDQSQSSNGRAWVSGTTTPPFNPQNFNEGLGVFDLDSIDFPAVWRFRAQAEPVSAGGGRYFGIDHQPIGAAQLEPNGDGHLTVSNIGSSGKDGVSIDLGETDAFVTEMPLPVAPPPGARVLSFPTISVNGGPAQPGGKLGVIRTRDGYDTIVDFSDLGSPTYTARVFSGEEQVLESSGLVSGDVQMKFGIDVELKCDCTWLSWCWTLDIAIEFSVGGSSVKGDHVVFEPDSPMPGNGVMTHVDMLGLDMDPIIVRNEALRLFGNDHYAAGPSWIDAQDNAMGVSQFSNISIGGVCVQFPPRSIGARIDFEPIEPLPGQTWMLRARGTLDDVTDQTLGSVTGTATDAGVELSADFSDLGGTLVRVAAYRFGDFQGSVVLPAGSLGVISEGPNGEVVTMHECGKLPGRVPWTPPCYWIESPWLLTFTASNGTVFTGNELRILAVDAPSNISSIDEFDILGLELEPFTITRDVGLPDELNMDRPTSEPDSNPLDAVTDPTGPRHELYPIYCNDWTCDDWLDTNGDGELGVCDWVHFRKNSDDGDGDWYHVEAITITITVREQAPPFQLLAMDYTGDDIEGTMNQPVNSQWHEVYPDYCNLHNQKQWQDNGEPGLSEDDKIMLVDKQTGEAKWYRITAVSTDITIRKGTPPQPRPCPADLTGDQTVDVNDLLMLLAAWGTSNDQADINDDGIVNVSDLLELLAQWGPCP